MVFIVIPLVGFQRSARRSTSRFGRPVSHGDLFWNAWRTYRAFSNRGPDPMQGVLLGGEDTTQRGRRGPHRMRPCPSHRAHDYRGRVPVSRSYVVPHVQTDHNEGGDIADRCGEAAGFQAEGRLVHSYEQPAGTKYKTLQIRKRSVRQRTIKAPVVPLRPKTRRISCATCRARPRLVATVPTWPPTPCPARPCHGRPAPIARARRTFRTRPGPAPA